MQCGAKCFLVLVEKKDGSVEQIEVRARTQSLARKVANAQPNVQKLIQIKQK